jgi:hypothetical protein
VSQQIYKHPVGYVGGFLTMDTPAYFAYLPMLMTVVSHSTRYIKYYVPLAIVCMVLNGFIAQKIMERDL